MPGEVQPPLGTAEPPGGFVTHRLGPQTRAWCAQLRRRMNTDWDNMIGIQGERGSGKSTLALHIALQVDPHFNPNHVFYEPQDWQRVIHPRARREVYILDEGTNIAFNRTWQNRGQVALMQLLNTVRQRNHTIIWCAPNLERMDVVVRGDIVTNKLTVIHRGKALLQDRKTVWSNEHGDWVQRVVWSRRFFTRYGSLEHHPIWPQYVSRKAQAFTRRTNAKATEASSDSSPTPEDSFQEPVD